MKRLLLVLFFIASVTSAFAAELKVTGDLMVQGNFDSYTPDPGVNKRATYFEEDVNIMAAIVVNQDCTIFTKLTYDRHDQRLNGANMEQQYLSGQVADGSGNANDVGFAIERAYVNYKLAPWLQLNTGLMQGGKWASNFGDTEINVPRVQFIAAFSADMIFFATYEKNAETSITATRHDTDDINTMYLSAVIGVGPVKLLPLLKYVTNDASAGYNIKTYAGDLGVNGTFGMISLVSEWIYAKVDKDGSGTDSTLYGAYVDVAANLAPVKVGVAAFYCSSDASKGSYATGDDFNFTTVVGDMDEVTTNGTIGLTAAKVYGEFKMDKLTFGGCFAYFMSTDSAVYGYQPLVGGYSLAPANALKDFSAWEVDASVNYAFDANASYEIGGGYAAGEATNLAAATVKATQYRVYHKFAVKF